MSSLQFSSLYNSNTGFTNQIISLISAIMMGIRKGKKIIILGKFLNQYNDPNSLSFASEIFDLDYINSYLQNIKLICISNFNYELIKNDDQLVYSVNGEIFTDPQTNNVYKGGNNYPFSYLFYWISHNRNLYDYFFQKIRFRPIVKDISIIPNDLPEKLNVLHLRNEEDAIKHWSKQNRMSECKFLTKLNQLYIKNILKYIDPLIPILIISSNKDQNSEIYSFLRSNNYMYILKDALFQQRELNAIYEFNCAIKCNEVFIGNFNLDGCNGSSFSYLIYKNINPKISVMIDLDHLNNN